MNQSMSNDQARMWQDLQGQPGNYYLTASDSEKELFRDWVRNLLTEDREVTVDFTKANGDFRSMKCTLNESLGAKYANERPPARPKNAQNDPKPTQKPTKSQILKCAWSGTLPSRPGAASAGIE